MARQINRAACMVEHVFCCPHLYSCKLPVFFLLFFFTVAHCCKQRLILS